MSPADQMWWFGLLVGLGSVPMTSAIYYRLLLRDEPPAWMKEWPVAVLTGQLVAPVGVLSLAWLAWA